MVRNAIESNVRSSKMNTGGHFENKIKTKKGDYWYEMARNAIERDFRPSRMVAGGHFENSKNKSCILIWNGEKCDQKWFSVIQNGRCENLKKVEYLSEMGKNVIKSNCQVPFSGI